MRKLTVSVTLNQAFVYFIKATAGFYERIEVLEILKENNAKGYTLGIARILLCKGYSLKDVNFPGTLQFSTYLSLRIAGTSALSRSPFPRSSCP